MDDELAACLDRFKRITHIAIIALEPDATYRQMAKDLIVHGASTVQYGDIPSEEDIQAYRSFLKKVLEDVTAFEKRLIKTEEQPE